MTLCPYCGEDVPAETPRCWKCGSDLPADGADPALGEARRSSDHPSECRACQAPLPPGARRCAECDRPVRGAPRGLPTVFAVYGATLLALLVGLVYALATRREAPARPSSARAIEYAELLRVYADGAANEQAREVWRAAHEGRRVEWREPAVILGVGEGGVLKLGPAAPADGPAARPTVVLALADPGVIDERALAPRQALGCAYQAVLDRIEDGTVYLASGRLIEPVPPADR